jgi:flagellar hook-associated protein 2
MSSFTVGGLSTGVDYNELIDKMMEAKRAPIRVLENKRDDYSDKISAYSELSDKMAALKTAVTNLKTTSSFYQKQASVNDTTVLDVTVTGTASSGNYSVSVTSLASEEKEVHNGTGLTASTDVVNSSGSDKVFQYTYAGTQRSITVPDGTTLDGLKTLINDDTGNPGVSATVVSDGSNYRLILTGDDTGASNTITIDSGTTLDGTGSTVDFTASSFSETKSASDASFSIDGLAITRSSNTVSDVIEGMTITLKKAGSSTTISVTADTDAIKSQIEDFVSAYNEVISFLTTNMDYDEATNTAGVLNGEGTARNVHSSLRDIVSSSISGLTGDINLLALIGITSNSKTGELEINGTTLDTKLSSSMDDVAEMFTDSSNGLAVQLYDYINQVTSSVDGSIKLREDGLQDVIDNINDNIDDMEYRLDKTENDLVRKFTALETLVSGFNTMGNFLTNQLSRLA